MSVSESLFSSVYDVVRSISGAIANGQKKGAGSIGEYLEDKDIESLDIEKFSDAITSADTDSEEFWLVAGIALPVVFLLIIWMIVNAWQPFWVCAQCCMCCCCTTRETCCCCCCCWNEKGPKPCCQIYTKISFIILAVLIMLTAFCAAASGFAIPEILDHFEKVATNGYTVTGRIQKVTPIIDDVVHSVNGTITNVIGLVDSYLSVKSISASVNAIKETIQTELGGTIEALTTNMTAVSTALDPSVAKQLWNLNSHFVASQDQASSGENIIIDSTMAFTLADSSNPTTLQCTSTKPADSTILNRHIQEYLDILAEHNSDYLSSHRTNVQNLLKDVTSKIQATKDKAKSELEPWKTRLDNFLKNVVAVKELVEKNPFNDVMTQIDEVEVPTLDEDTFGTDTQNSELYKQIEYIYHLYKLAELKLRCCGFSPADTAESASCQALWPHVRDKIHQSMPDEGTKPTAEQLFTSLVLDPHSPYSTTLKDGVTKTDIVALLMEDPGHENLETARKSLTDHANSAKDSYDSTYEQVNSFKETDVTDPYDKAIDNIKQVQEDTFNDDFPLKSSDLDGYVADLNATIADIARILDLTADNAPDEQTGDSYLGDTSDLDTKTYLDYLRTGSTGIGAFFLLFAILVLIQFLCGVFFDITSCYCCCSYWHFCYLTWFGLLFTLIGIFPAILREVQTFYFSDDFGDMIKVGETVDDSGIIVQKIADAAPEVDLDSLVIDVSDELTLDFSDLITLDYTFYGNLLNLLLRYNAKDANSLEKNPIYNLMHSANEKVKREFSKLEDLSKFVNSDSGITIGPYAQALFDYSLNQQLKVKDTNCVTYLKETVANDQYLKDAGWELTEIKEEESIFGLLDKMFGALEDLSSSDVFPLLLSVVDPVAIYVPRGLLFFFSSSLLLFFLLPCFICCTGCARTMWPDWPEYANIITCCCCCCCCRYKRRGVLFARTRSAETGTHSRKRSHDVERENESSSDDDSDGGNDDDSDMYAEPLPGWCCRNCWPLKIPFRIKVQNGERFMGSAAVFYGGDEEEAPAPQRTKKQAIELVVEDEKDESDESEEEETHHSVRSPPPEKESDSDSDSAPPPEPSDDDDDDDDEKSDGRVSLSPPPPDDDGYNGDDDFL